MELSEKWIQTFEREGFKNVYEWDDLAGTVYEPHTHQGKVSIYITDGSCTFTINGKTREVKAKQRFDIPMGVEHSAVVGSDGWIVIVGEEIEGDS